MVDAAVGAVSNAGNVELVTLVAATTAATLATLKGVAYLAGWSTARSSVAADNIANQTRTEILQALRENGAQLITINDSLLEISRRLTDIRVRLSNLHSVLVEHDDAARRIKEGGQR